VTTSDVKSISEIIDLELPKDLAASESALVTRWESGFHDEETALRLAFIEWWACCEPEFLTGLENGSDVTSTKPSHFDAILDHLLSDEPVSPRALFVLGWMCEMSPWCCGRQRRNWEALGTELLERFDNGLDLPVVPFERVSTFGHYFDQMLAKRRANIGTQPDQ